MARHTENAILHELTAREADTGSMAFMVKDMWSRLWDILNKDDEDSLVYVYRVREDGKPTCPFILRCRPYPGLLDFLGDEYGGGNFRVLIRRQRHMIFSGKIGIDSPSAQA